MFFFTEFRHFLVKMYRIVVVFVIYLYSCKKNCLDTPKEPVISKVAERKMSPTEEEDEDSEKVTEKKRVNESRNKHLSISYFYCFLFKNSVFCRKQK